MSELIAISIALALPAVLIGIAAYRYADQLPPTAFAVLFAAVLSGGMVALESAASGGFTPTAAFATLGAAVVGALLIGVPLRLARRGEAGGRPLLRS